MTLSPSFLLAPHFTAHELRADTPGIPATAEANLFKTAAWLEAARATLGVPLVITSGYRSPTYNASVGGSRTSDHVTGLAADFKAQGLSPFRVYEIFKTAPLPSFDQIIFYPVTGHIHVGLGARMRGEFRIALAEGGYPLLTPELAAKLRGAMPVLLILLLVGLLVYAVAQKGA